MHPDSESKTRLTSLNADRPFAESVRRKTERTGSVYSDDQKHAGIQRVPTAEKQGKRKSGSEKTAGSVQNEKL